MKIIVEGDIEKSKAIELFRCNDCGCEFEAERTEYKKEVERKRSGYKIYKYTVRDGCPCCRHWCGKTLIEKPEKKPIYPTWENWLTTLGVQSYNELSNPIPADIAQKLGIEPKEG